MRKIPIFIIVLAGLLTARVAWAQPQTRQQADALWQEAATAYQEGNWQHALELYKSLESAGYGGAALDYNIGNCYYKAGGYLGTAILYYERALKQDPQFADAAFNLEMLRQQTLDQIEVVPEFVLITWLRKIRETVSMDVWAGWAIAFFALTLVGFLFFRYGGSRRLRKTAFTFSVLFLLCSLLSAGFGMSARKALQREDTAVVIAPVSSVKSSPAAGGNNLFILHEGTKVLVLETLGDWTRIELSDGRQGWIQKKETMII